MCNSKRPKPCKVCKLQRKKCVWSCSSTRACDRCSKLNIVCCKQLNDSDEFHDEGIELMAQDGNQELRKWWNDVKRLDTEIQQLQSTTNDLARVGSPDNSQQQEQVCHQQPEWQLSIVNGFLHLDTPIQTLEEFIQFTQASLRYLSPFAGLFNQAPVRFESTSISTTLGMGAILQRILRSKPRKKRFEAIGYNDNNVNRSILLEPWNYRAIMHYIIPLYLEHYNAIMGRIHAPTFLQHYQSLRNPLECPIVLAVCIEALVSLRHVLEYTAYQRRIIAEEFYSRCYDLLFDLYEDPTRKLDVVIVSSLVQPYLTNVTLRYPESMRLASLALLICAELEKEEHKMDRVERALFQRHRLYLEICSRSFDMAFEDKIDFTIPERILKLEVLDDEPEKTRQHIQLYNHVFGLLGTPYISTIMGQVGSIIYGQPCELLLEDILQYEPIVLDWWKGLPAELRICQDPFDPMAYTLVEKQLAPLQLYPFIGLHLLTGLLTSSILQPQFAPAVDNAVSINVIRAVRERLKALALNSSRILVYALKGNWALDSCDVPYFSFSIMAHVLYSLEKLGYCADLPFPRQLLLMMKEDFNIKKAALLPADHQVPPSSSVVTSFLKNADLSSAEMLYEKYPLPGVALLSDMLISSFTQLDQRFLNVMP